MSNGIYSNDYNRWNRIFNGHFPQPSSMTPEPPSGIPGIEVVYDPSAFDFGASGATGSSGYDPSGYDPSGYDPSGYDPSGYDPSGYLPSGYDPNNSGAASDMWPSHDIHDNPPFPSGYDPNNSGAAGDMWSTPDNQPYPSGYDPNNSGAGW